MHETAAEQKESRSPEAPADIVILFILMSMAKQDNYKKREDRNGPLFSFFGFWDARVYLDCETIRTFFTLLV